MIKFNFGNLHATYKDDFSVKNKALVCVYNGIQNVTLIMPIRTINLSKPTGCIFKILSTMLMKTEIYLCIFNQFSFEK